MLALVFHREFPIDDSLSAILFVVFVGSTVTPLTTPALLLVGVPVGVGTWLGLSRAWVVLLMVASSLASTLMLVAMSVDWPDPEVPYIWPIAIGGFLLLSSPLLLLTCLFSGLALHGFTSRLRQASTG